MRNKHRTIWDELEQGFGGGSKFRVFLQLLLNPTETLTKYALVKATGLRTPSVDSQLKVLIKLGWVKEYAFTPKTYEINLESEVVKQISEVFEKIKYIKSGM